MAFVNNLYSKFKNTFSRSFPRFFDYCERHKSIIKFFITGSISGTVDLLTLFILHQLLAKDIIFSTSMAFIISFMISFGAQKLWTFRNYNQAKLPRQFILYFANAVISLALNGLAMHYLVNSLNIWYLLAQIIVNLVLGFVNFVSYKYIIFKVDKHENKNC